MSSTAENRPSLIQNLLYGRRKKNEVLAEGVDQELDLALSRLTRALNENEEASKGVRRRQSSGSLKLLSLPDQIEAE